MTSRAYQARRIELGVPEEGRDYPLGETFPHEADFDLFNGCLLHQGLLRRQEWCRDAEQDRGAQAGGADQRQPSSPAPRSSTATA
jgi:hypothetical protein